jgi:PAS domain-containing protein
MRRRSVFNILGVFLFLITVWIIGSAGEEYFGVTAYGMFWTKMKNVGAILLEPTWLMLAIIYSGIFADLKPLDKRLLPLIYVVPAICITGALTDNRFHLFYGTLRNGYGNGPLFKLMFIYGLIAVVIGLIIITGKLFETRTPRRYQLIVLIIFFILAPMIGRMLEFRRVVEPGSPACPLLTSLGAIACIIGTKWFAMIRWLPVSISEVVESMPSGVIVIDRNGELITLNPAAARLLGLEDGAELAELIEELADKFSQGKLGPTLSFDLDLGGRLIRFQRIGLKRPEEDNDSLIISVTDISAGRDAQQDFVSSMSAELQPHFESVSKSIKRIENTAQISNPDNISAFSELRRARFRLEQLAAQLELFSKLESGEFLPKPESIDLVSIIASSAKHLKEIHAADGCCIETNLPAAIRYNADPVLFSTLVESLVSGLAKYCDSKKIELKAYIIEDGIVLDASCSIHDRLSARNGSRHSDSTSEISARFAISDAREISISICRAIAALLNSKFNVETSGGLVRFVAVLPKI